MRRHQEHVAAGFDLVRQRIVVGDLHRELLRILLVQPAEHALRIRDRRYRATTRISSSQRQTVGDLQDQVEPLLRRKARDDADDRQLRVVRQAEFFQQIALARRLAAEVVGRIVRGDERIGLRIPLAVVDAIQNARDGAAARAQHAFQTKAVLRRLDLLAYLRLTVVMKSAIGDCALQEIHLAVEFQLRHGEQVPGQHQQRQDLRRKHSLVADVVDGEDHGVPANAGSSS